MSNNWYYRKQIGDAGVNKKPARLKDLGEHSVRIFVREVIQNNLDAGESGKTVTVEIRIQKWGKEQIKNFFEFIGKDHLELLKKSSLDPDPSVVPYLKNCLEIINGKIDSTFLVVVEEINCIGLTGPVRENKSEKSHFDALMRKVENNEAKKETTNTGGTWGKGSSIFTYTSELWTWFSYTKLSKPWYDEKNNLFHKSRFIGRCMIAPYFDENKNESILGDGWYCDNEKSEKEKIDAYPFVNDKADEFAIKLGLTIRDKAEGTTFYIPFFKPQLEEEEEKLDIITLQKEFITQVMQNWFIPIYNDQLIVKISTSEETVEIDSKYLQIIPELKFKLQLLNWYERGCPPDDKRFIKETLDIEVPALKEDYLGEKRQFAKLRQKVKADLVVRVLDEEEDFIDNWGTINKVALSRNKGMVITDKEFINNNQLRTECILFTGLLVKNEDLQEKKQHLDLFLAYSENPAHNKWCDDKNDYSECFLDRFKGLNPRPEYSIHRLFLDIFSVFKKLLAEDIVQKESKDICNIFKKLAKLKSRGDDPSGKRLFFMRTIDEDIDKEGRYIFTKKIISSEEESNIEVFFKSYIDSLEGESDKGFENLGIKEYSNLEILNQHGEMVSFGINPKITLSPKQEIIVKIRTCGIDKNVAFKNLDPLVKLSAKII